MLPRREGRVRLVLGVLLVGLAVWACPPALASQQVGTIVPPAMDTASSWGREPLRPGDLVRVRIAREPELSGEFVVDEAGVAVFPTLGPIRVTSFGADSLRALLVGRYAEYLRDPAIEVRSLRRVRVLGAVRTPGLYQVDATMSMGDVLALAGGLTPEAARGRVDLVRDEGRERTSLDDAAMLGTTAIRSGDQLIVPERGWWRRNAGTVLGVATSVAGLLVSLAVWGND